MNLFLLRAYILLFDREVWKERLRLWRIEINIIKLKLWCLALRFKIWIKE